MGTRFTARKRAGLALTFWVFVGGGSLLLALTGCGGSTGVKATIEAHVASPTEPTILEVHAEVLGDQTGLVYKWYSTRGKCTPQESTSPLTLYESGPGVASDRIALEIWRDRTRVAQSQTVVQIAERPIAADRILPAVQIEITEVPPYDPEGDSPARHHIAGKVIGTIDPAWLVVIYKRRNVGVWEVQPNPYEKHALRSDNSWSTWTHSGESYAVLVVRPEYTAPGRVNMIPLLGGDVLARVVFEGEKE